MPKQKVQVKESERREKYTCSLKVELSREEVADRADRAAAKLAEIDQKEEEQKAAAKHAKSIIEALSAELRALSHEVRTRSTYRMVDCERVHDHDAGRVREVRLDTSEVITDRPLTDAERQRQIPFEDNGDEGTSDG